MDRWSDKNMEKEREEDRWIEYTFIKRGRCLIVWSDIKSYKLKTS